MNLLRYTLSLTACAVLSAATVQDALAQASAAPATLTGHVYWGPGDPSYNPTCDALVIQYDDSSGATHFVAMSVNAFGHVMPVKGTEVSGALNGFGHLTLFDVGDNDSLPAAIFFRADDFSTVAARLAAVQCPLKS